MNNLAFQIAVHVFAHGTAILLVAGLANRCLPDWPAASKHAVWTTAFTVLLLLPVGYGVLPAWEIGVLPSSNSNKPAPYSTVSSTPIETAPVEASRNKTDTRDIEDAVSFSSPPPSPGVSSGADETFFSTVSSWWAPIFLLVWTGGVLLLLGRLGLGLLVLRRWKAHATPAGCSGLARRLSHRFDLRRSVEVLEHAEASAPIAWGLFSPTIILPPASRDWSQTRLEVVLLHELAHLKRWDDLTRLLGRIVRALFWPNPLIWVAVPRSSAVQEQACDDAVLRSGLASWTYAEELLAIVKTVDRPFSATLGINSGLRFKARMRALLQSTTPRRAVGWEEAGAIGLVGLLLLVTVSAFSFSSTSHPPPRHWIEAETASLPAAFEPNEDEEASQGTYVEVTDRADDLDRPPEGESAVYSFETPRSGRHVIWARVKVPSDQPDRHNSFWVRVDSTQWIRWNEIEQGEEWHWVQVRDFDRGERPVAFPLTEGEHHLTLAPREDEIALDRLLVTPDWNYQPRGSEVEAPPDDNAQIWIEAESGWLQSPFRVAHAPGASDWKYIEADQHADDLNSPPTTGRATYSFTAPRPGTYRLWGRVIAETGTENSFWVRVDEGPWIRWNEIQYGDEWHWEKVHDDREEGSVRFELSEGSHRLTVAYRERETKLDRFLLTSSPTYRPRGAGARSDSLAPISRELPLSDADVTPPMLLRTDSQSATPQPWLEVPDGPGNDPPEGGPGAATFTFSVPQAGQYVIWGEVQAPTPNDNSFYVSIDGGEEAIWHTPAPGETTSGWRWDPISDGDDDAFTDPLIFDLDEGTHQLRLRNREDGTRLRWLRITNSIAPSPLGNRTSR